jgi:DNA-binding NtrC family response regulator
MPKLSGIDALKIIKKLTPDVPCIAFSGKAGASERAEAVQCGALKCLEKPFALSQLKEDIKKHLFKQKETL